MFAAQVVELRDFYGIQPGGLDLPGFPLFALFNAAMGMTTVIPEMDPTRPAQVDPEKIARAILEEGVSQGFGSPAIWKRVGPWCKQHRVTFPTLKRVFSAGAPVPVDVLASMKKALVSPDAEMHTPYGATEALPVCSISATEVLSHTAAKTREGAGTCVGRQFPGIRLKIIRITDTSITDISSVDELPTGEIGEIIVRGPVVTREYFRQPEATRAAKIADGDGFWHRMGDVGYLDAEGLLWFCGRKGHRVETESGAMFTDCIEPVFNTHPRVARCALVGVGERSRQVPVIVIEGEGRVTLAEIEPELRRLAASHDTTRPIEKFLLYAGSFPVDVRHNIKINREAWAVWASEELAKGTNRREHVESNGSR
jgi:acyl-CoA synthetase (AMP-forming)/AMP-acid ligase II